MTRVREFSSSRTLRLRELAEKATHGPWVATRKARNPKGKPDEVWTADKERFVAECMQGDPRNGSMGMVADAAYLAALDPDTVLKLLAVVEAAQAVGKCRNPEPPCGYCYACHVGTAIAALEGDA